MTTNQLYPRCKTCKHWEKAERDYPYPRHCAHDKLGEDLAVIRLEGEKVLPMGDCLTYSYLEGGVFHPGPEFGCIHHET